VLARATAIFHFSLTAANHHHRYRHRKSESSSPLCARAAWLYRSRRRITTMMKHKNLALAQHGNLSIYQIYHYCDMDDIVGELIIASLGL
jgi:hypothetical protein